MITYEFRISFWKGSIRTRVSDDTERNQLLRIY